MRKKAVAAKYPGMQRTDGIGIEVDHLAGRMNTGIGPARTDGGDRLTAHRRKCGFNRGLDARRMRLYLPAGEDAAVVLDAGGDAHQREYSAGRKRAAIRLGRA